MLRRKIMIVPAALAVAASLYGAAWLYAAHRLETGIAAWAEARRAEGWRMEYASLAVEGFPLRLRARIAEPAATAPRPAAPRWSAPVLLADLVPWRPDRVLLHAPRPSTVAWTGPAAGRAELGRARALARLARNGHVERAELAIDDVVLFTPPEGPPATVNRITATVGRERPEDDADAPAHRRVAFTVKGEMLGLTLPEGLEPTLGRTVGRIALDAQVLGETVPGRPAVALAAWRDSGGTVEVRQFALGWGPLIADGDGTLALDAGLQPEGALTARIAGFDATVETLVAAGIVKARHGVLIGYALNALAKRPEGGGPPVIEAPITLQGGRLFIGPIALLPLPRIDWQ